jgi:hypothetical protein
MAYGKCEYFAAFTQSDVPSFLFMLLDKLGKAFMPLLKVR